MKDQYPKDALVITSYSRKFARSQFRKAFPFFSMRKLKKYNASGKLIQQSSFNEWRAKIVSPICS